MTNYIFFLLGNYGVGKSSIIKKEIIDKQGFYLNVGNNVWVLGEKINGADSLSGIDKNVVYDSFAQNKDKNIIIAGIYYSGQIDVSIAKKTHIPVVIYLNTNYENNSLRIVSRGGLINVATYNSKLKIHYNLLKKLKGNCIRHILNNNRKLDAVKNDFWQIVNKYIGKE